MNRKKIIIVDFGGQYNQLVACHVRESHVYCKIYSYKTDTETTRAMNSKGVILTGGPNSRYEEGVPTYSRRLFELGIPVLGLCCGAQLTIRVLDDVVAKAPMREYDKIEIIVDKSSKLFDNVSEKIVCQMSHNGYAEKTIDGFRIIAHIPACSMAAVECVRKRLYTIQYHPEVLHTQEGFKVLSSFVCEACGCAGDWKMDAFVENIVQAIHEKVGDGKVLYILLGGVGSFAATMMLAKAVGGQLICVSVDHGLLCRSEGDEVEGIFRLNGNHDLNFIRINAQEGFYERLAGVTEPETKRKIIGEGSIRAFEKETKKIGKMGLLVQGTIYPDAVEGGLGGKSVVIKFHRNVNGLPDFIDFKEIIGPLHDLPKDEVREAGLELGIPEKLVYRQPFPGPGLSVRIMGEVTVEKIKIVQDANAIHREEIAAVGLDKNIGQHFAALTSMQPVGVMDDERTHDCAITLQVVNTVDFMTAEFAGLLQELLGKVSSRVVSEMKHVNRVLYDCTKKPPATTEFE